MVGDSHLDPVWLWQWQEGFQAMKATFRSALDRMKEYPDFKYSSNSAAIYEWLEHNDPKMFAEVKARVQEVCPSLECGDPAPLSPALSPLWSATEREKGGKCRGKRGQGPHSKGAHARSVPPALGDRRRMRFSVRSCILSRTSGRPRRSAPLFPANSL